MVVPSREPVNTYLKPLPTDTQTPLPASISIDIEDYQLRGCSLLPSTNNHLRSQSVDSTLTTSSIDYAKQMETQNTKRLWAEQLEQEEQLPLSLQQNMATMRQTDPT